MRARGGALSGVLGLLVGFWNDKGPAVASEALLSSGRLVIALAPKLPPKRSSKPDAFAERVPHQYGAIGPTCLPIQARIEWLSE